MRRNILILIIGVVVAFAVVLLWRARFGSPEKPPPVGFAVSTLNHADYAWVSTETPHLRVHCREGSFAAQRMKSLARHAERSRAKALEIIGEDSYKRPIDVFYVDSRDDMRELVGRPVSGWTDWESSTVLLVANDKWRPFDQHEIMHVVSLNLWGDPAAPREWIREGLAVYADGFCGGYEIDDVARYMQGQGLLVDPDSLVQDFFGQNDLIAYLQSGSFIGFLYERYGLENLHELWRRGVGQMNAIYGHPFAELERLWRSDWLRGSAGAEVDWDTLSHKGCG